MPEDPTQPDHPPARSASDRLRGVEIPPPDGLPPQWEAHRRPGVLAALTRVLLLLALLAMFIIPFTPAASRLKQWINALVEKSRSQKVVVKEVPKEIVREVVREVPKLEPLPSKFVPRKEIDVASLFNGITIETKVETSEGTYASLETNNADAYKVEFQLKLRVPKPNQTVEELSRLNEFLPKMLPSLGLLLETGKVSGFYHKLYENKVNGVQRSLTHLNRLLDRHNFFDCETILDLQNPDTKRRAVLIQSDMDVVADGSDGDRLPEMTEDIYKSDYYQPFTTYEWAKRTKTANPLLAKWQAKYEALKSERENGKASTARKNEIKAQMQHLDTEIKALKSRSSLIGDKDPFIVISLLFKDYPRTMPDAPAIGDYAVVIHKDKIYPAICGDYGPSMKMGEASLLIAKKCSEKATPYNRGEDELKATYVIFPGTADKPFGPPDLDKWHEKVSAYLQELGGLGKGFSVYQWENPFPAKAGLAAAGDEDENGPNRSPPMDRAGDEETETVKPAVPAAANP